MAAILLFETEPAEYDGVLYRALRDDVRFGFAAVSGVGDESAGGVALIEPFAVPEGSDEDFLAAWERLRAARAQQRGYLGSRLLPGPGDLRFVDFTRWSSPLMFARALELADVQEAAAAMPFASHPALYLPVR